jgi:tRNA A-37 threonylcarbamoyl transferase component Bud32
MVGATLAHYRVLELLGRGGMGEVYAAEDLKLKRRVALKVLPADVADNPERRRRFEREAQAVASLNHPGIVTIYSVEHADGRSFLSMELVEGRTLEQAVPVGGLPLAGFLTIAIQLADALNAAHERGILHRDLKPGNVMLTHGGRIKVLDFGLAKLATAAPARALEAYGPLTTSSGQIVGTLSYMAPEQAEGRTVDHRADIFGLGVLLYELLAGIRPFAGESNVALLTSLLRDTPRPITEVRRDVPEELAPIVQKCLEKDPTRRYQSAADLRVALETVQARTQPRLRRPLPRAVLGGAVATVLLLTGFVGWFGAGANDSADAPQADASVTALVLINGRSVAILDLTNRTGDPSLAVFGRMISESIATSLAAEGIPVVTATEASAADGLTIAGGYALDRGELRIDVQVLAASRGTAVRVLDTIRVPRSALEFGAETTRQRTVSAVQAVFASQPPTAAAGAAATAPTP